MIRETFGLFLRRWRWSERDLSRTPSIRSGDCNGPQTFPGTSPEWRSVRDAPGCSSQPGRRATVGNHGARDRTPAGTRTMIRNDATGHRMREVQRQKPRPLRNGWNPRIHSIPRTVPEPSSTQCPGIRRRFRSRSPGGDHRRLRTLSRALHPVGGSTARRITNVKLTSPGGSHEPLVPKWRFPSRWHTALRRTT